MERNSQLIEKEDGRERNKTLHTNQQIKANFIEQTIELYWEGAREGEREDMRSVAI